MIIITKDIKMKEILTKHLKENRMTYRDHFVRSAKFSLYCLIMSVVCAIHSLLPFVFEKTFSSYIKRVSKILDENH